MSVVRRVGRMASTPHGSPVFGLGLIRTTGSRESCENQTTAGQIARPARSFSSSL